MSGPDGKHFKMIAGTLAATGAAHHCSGDGQRGDIIETRDLKNGQRKRRYQCRCGNRWTTYERKAK